jgi:GNAT superfamily N-acetyltransferase
MALWRVRATVDDRPGFLAVLAASLALRSVNILSVQVHATEAGAVDDFLVDAPDAMSEADLLTAVVKGRGRDPWVRRADADGLRDAPTLLLNLATRLVDGDEIGTLLTSLLGDVLVTWRPEPAPASQRQQSPSSPGHPADIMVLPDPAGGSLEVRRLEPPFTPAEYARADALVDLAASVARQAQSRYQVLLPDGAELTVRPAQPHDLDAVRQMHERCSVRSRYGRYLSGAGVPSDAALHLLLHPGQGHALVAETTEREPAKRRAEAPTRIVALATLTWDAPDPGRAEADLAAQELAELELAELELDETGLAGADLGLLVVDDWQRRGLGTALARRALRLAMLAGRETVHVRAHAENSPMIRTMHRLDLPLRAETEGSIVTLSVDVRAGSGTPFPVQ